MSIQILPEGQNLASSFGQALGQGVSQQLPEEIKRYRLKSGLEDLASQKDLSPVNLLSKLITIPGMDAQTASTLYPAIVQQIQHREQEGAGQGFGQTQGQNVPAFGQNANQNQLNSPPGLNLAPQGNQPPRPEPINELANNLYRTQPFTFPTFSAAQAEAQKRITNVETELDKQFQSFLQKGQTLQEGEIGGDVRDMMRQRAIQDLATSGASERSIAQKYARQGKEIAKEYGSLKGIRNQTGIFNRPDQGTINSIRGIDHRLEALGVPRDQIIDNNVADLNISKAAASYILDPLDNSKAGSYLKKVKDQSLFGPNPKNAVFVEKGPKVIQINKRNTESPEIKMAKEIAPLITSKDLMGSIAYIAAQKGYDPRLLLDQIQRIRGDSLSTEQSRDIANQALVPVRRSLDEYWLLNYTGEKKKARQVK